MKTAHEFFDELKRRIDHLNKFPKHDNEASRHDWLVLPFLNSPFTLGWNTQDILSQQSIIVPKEVKESHIFRNAIPKFRTPDIILSPLEIQGKIAAVIEEKHKQNSIDDLHKHKLQLTEYQSIYDCTWGILTDGEKWIIKRNFEMYHIIHSINELQQHLTDLQNTIGKKAVMERYKLYGTTDLVFSIIMSMPQTLESDIEAKNNNIHQNPDSIYPEKIREKLIHLERQARDLNIDMKVADEDLSYFEIEDSADSKLFERYAKDARSIESEYYRTLDAIAKVKETYK